MKNSIYGKIRKRVLLGSLASAVAVCLAAVVCIFIMRGNVIGASGRLGASAADDSKEALELQMRESLLRLVMNKAAISDGQLAAVSRLVTVVARNASETVSSREIFLPYEADFPVAANAGRTVAQLRLPEGMAIGDVKDEAGLLGHISPLLISQHDSLDYVRSVYIGTENGVSISADKDSDLKTSVYDPRTRGWYISAKDAGELIWTDVFADNSGRGLAITCATPFYGPDGGLFGVAGAGMELSALKKTVMEINLGETGYAFIANKYGDLIISDMVTVENDVIVSPNLGDILPSVTAARIISGQTGIERVSIDGEDFFIAYTPLETLPWSLSVVMSVEEVIAPATISGRNIIGMTLDAVAGIDRMIFVVLGVFAAALLLTLIGNVVLARQMAAGLAKPIIELNAGAGIIGAGDLDYSLVVKTGDEIEALADAFNAMIKSVKTITADKERISAELSVATEIQSDMLPKIFPPYSNRDDVHIAPIMRPAKEVGGDFYDFFFLDAEQTKLALVIADVSGKGVPAALFMVIAKVLIKNNKHLPPEEVLYTVNNLLGADNNASMFVTAFYSVLDLVTGEYAYAGAGHNPPLLCRAGSGSADYLTVTKAPPLALFPDKKYSAQTVALEKGDTLLLYTDGVTESFNTASEMYGANRLLQNLNGFSEKTVEDIVIELHKTITDFAGGEPQSDDITMLCCRFFGRVQ